MHMKVPFLAILVLSVFQLTVYGIQNNDHSKKDLDDVLSIDQAHVVEIEISDFSGRVHHTKDPELMREILDYFNQFQYQRLRNDQTSYMPNNTMMISIYDEYQTDFIIPYGKEAFISNKVYQIKNGTINQDELLEILELLLDRE